MRVQSITKSTDDLPIAARSLGEEGLLIRWSASHGQFVVGEFDWRDPLDAALGIELVRFRPGIDQYDA